MTFLRDFLLCFHDAKVTSPSQTTKYHDKIVYGELDLMVEHRTQFAFKGNREHIANTLKLKYHMVQEIIKLCQIPSKLRLTLTLNQQTNHVIL